MKAAFAKSPTASNGKVHDEPIDAVITWVDGNDPAHRAKREAALKKGGRSGFPSGVIPGGKDSRRFTDNGEIYWCILSIRKFAPWIRHIHLVTDNQIPAFLTPEKQRELGVRLVDHTEIFEGYEWALPTFNAYAIETVLWRIQELSERFIFFNDDFILIRPVQATDFFNGHEILLRGRWQRIRGATPLHLFLNGIVNFFLFRMFNITRTMQLYAQMNGAKLANFKRRHYRSPHVPHPLRKETFSLFFRDEPETLRRNIQYAFRNAADFVPVSLANHLEIQKNMAHEINYADISMFSGEHNARNTTDKLLDYLELKPSPFLCLQALEYFDPPDNESIVERFKSIIGDMDNVIAPDRFSQPGVPPPSSG